MQATERTPSATPTEPSAGFAGLAASPGRRTRRFVGFLLYLLIAVSLPSQWLFWDDIGFLLAARAQDLDYGHMLYIPLLRAAAWLSSPLTESQEYAAKLVSMSGGALAFVLAWRRFERPSPRALAPLLALLVTATPIFWRQLSVIEPTTWTLALLLLAAEAAEAFGRERRATRAGAAALAYVLALGLHVVSLLALPWLVWLARGPAPRPSTGRLIAWPAGGLAVLLVVAEQVGDPLQRIGRFLRYWTSFVGSGDEAPPRVAWRLLTSGVPVLSAVVLVALATLALRRRGDDTVRERNDDARSWFVLLTPYLAALVVFGKPVVGLFVPITLALVGLVSTAARSWTQRAPNLTFAAFGVALTLQGFGALAFALHHATTPDQERLLAVRIAERLPRDAAVLAGPLAHHLRWHTDVPVEPLPNHMHGGDPAIAPLDRVLSAAEALLDRHARVYVTSEAVDYLETYWGIPRSAFPEGDPESISLPGEPPLTLHLFAGRRAGGE